MIALSGSLLGGSALHAVADPKPQATVPVVVNDATEEKGLDPNRIVCRREEVLGSRVQSRRVCRTAAEWEAKQLEDRQSIERSQTVRWKSE